MNKPNRDKILSITVMVTAAIAFATTTPVQADPTFPPSQHASNAQFDESGEPSTLQVKGPWYRPRTELPATDFEIAPASRLVAADRAPGPWYRAAN